jgi:hypothetical protein
MEKTPTDPPPERTPDWVAITMVSIAALMAVVLVVNLVDFGRLVMGGGHC